MGDPVAQIKQDRASSLGISAQELDKYISKGDRLEDIKQARANSQLIKKLHELDLSKDEIAEILKQRIEAQKRFYQLNIHLIL